MTQVLVFILLMSISYGVLFKLLPIVGAIPFILRHVKSEDMTGFRLLALTILYVPLAMVALQGVMHWRGYGLPELASTPTLLSIFLGLAGGIVSAALNLFTDLRIKALLREDFSSTLKQIGHSTAGLISMMVVSWLAGGVLEESFWRGFWFREWQVALAVCRREQIAVKKPGF